MLDLLEGAPRLVLMGRGQAWLWVATSVLATALVIWLSRIERTLLPASTRRLLTGLRLAAVGVLLFALFEPAMAWTRREVVRGRLILGVDLSASMETRDDARGRTRAERAASLARGEWLEPIRETNEVRTVAFAARAREVEGDELSSWLSGMDRDATDWDGVLEQALRAHDAGEMAVSGVVMMSDGAKTNERPSDGRDAAERLSALGIPVHSIVVGSNQPPADVAIARVDAPARAYQGDSIQVSAEIKGDGVVAGESLQVKLERSDGEPAIERTVVVPAAGARPTVTFPVTIDRAGTVEFVASVAVPAGFADAREDNNQRSVRVDVTDDRARVLLVDDEARWEFRYLQAALSRDRRVELRSVLFEPPPRPEEGTAEPTYDAGWPESGDAATAAGADPLSAFDVVIVGDVGPDFISDESWERLERFVSERGGTLVISAGRRFWRDTWLEQPIAQRLLPLRQIEPVLPEAGGRPPGALPPGVRPRPVSGLGEAWPMLRLETEDVAAWEGLPPLPWVIGGPVKPGATALLVSADSSSTGTTPAIVAAQAYGLGKVLWIGTDSTWRWRLGVGDRLHHRFWGQVVRWGAAAPLAGGNADVRFGPVGGPLRPGQPVAIEARFRADVPGVGPAMLVAARVEPIGPMREESTTPSITSLHARADQPRTFAGMLPPLAAGTYRLVLEVPDMAKRWASSPPTMDFMIAREETDERVELAARSDELRALASTTGGVSVAETEARRLVDAIRSKTKTRDRVEERSLWDTPWLLGLFVSLVSAEWIVRRRAGLP